MSAAIHRIGKSTTPRSAISTSDEEQIRVRGEDLCEELIGNIGFTSFFSLLVTGRRPSNAEAAVLDAALIAIAEHGMVPSIQAARMTYAAAPDAFQGAVAAGVLGCGSVILGAAEASGRLLLEVDAASQGSEAGEPVQEVLQRWRASGRPIPGFGHSLHKASDPRVSRLFEVARRAGSYLRFVRAAQAIEDALPSVIGKSLKMNVSVAIPAVLLGAGFPFAALLGVPILARTASLIAHLTEERAVPSCFALAHHAASAVHYEGK